MRMPCRIRAESVPVLAGRFRSPGYPSLLATRAARAGSPRASG
ncbi:hypothetical protein ACFPRL_28665 [Pseudoclavibacter helvolus]